MKRKQVDTIRASEADRILQCGAAARAVQRDIDISGPEALIGRAAHDAIEYWINGERKGEPETQPAANQHGVKPGDIAELIQNAPSMLKAIREDLSNLRAEVTISGGGVRGRIDVLSLTMAKTRLFSAAVLDWKTGRDPASSSKPGQRLAYASAVEASYGMPANGCIYTAELWLATGEIIESRFDAASIEGFRRRLAEQLERDTASPGPHCKYCRRAHECLERQQYLRAAVSAIAVPESKLATSEQLAALWDQSRALKAALETYERAIDLAIDEHGALELPDGRKLLHGTKSIDTIDAAKAWPVLRAAGLGRADIEGAIKLSKSKLCDAAAAKVPRGEKGAAKADLISALDTAGAIDRKTLKYRRVSAG
jgi:hypothetical protein